MRRERGSVQLPTVNVIAFDNNELFGGAKPLSRPQHWILKTVPGTSSKGLGALNGGVVCAYALKSKT